MYDLEHVIIMDSLYHAWQKISIKSACPGLDGVDLSFYRADLQKNLRSLQTSVVNGIYRPYTEKIYNHKDRAICIHSVEDKIIQTVLAETVMKAYQPSKNVHGFINKRSVFTAKKTLDNALYNGVYDYFKVDIRNFYNSIDVKMLFDKLSRIFTGSALLQLIELIVGTHSPGISTGSCLSPALSNLYLASFDREIESASIFYSRYVDDILVAPVSNKELIRNKLFEINLEMNPEKSNPVNAAKGFRYLGFDIINNIDAAIQNGDFSLAEEIYETQECDVSTTVQPEPEKPSAANAQEQGYRYCAIKCKKLRRIVYQKILELRRSHSKTLKYHLSSNPSEKRNVSIG